MRVILSGDATLFPKMLVFLESLGFERMEQDENRYFTVTLESYMCGGIPFCGIPFKRLTARYYSGSEPT
jgi:hypothetical protein